MHPTSHSSPQQFYELNLLPRAKFKGDTFLPCTEYSDASSTPFYHQISSPSVWCQRHREPSRFLKMWWWQLVADRKGRYKFILEAKLRCHKPKHLPTLKNGITLASTSEEFKRIYESPCWNQTPARWSQDTVTKCVVCDGQEGHVFQSCQHNVEYETHLMLIKIQDNTSETMLASNAVACWGSLVCI